MTRSRRGDIVLVGFEFSDASGTKRRPALVVSSDPYHRNRQEVIVAAITSNTVRKLYGDLPIREWREAGLLFPSTITGIVRTVKVGMIQRRLGALAPDDLEAATRQLRASLGL